MTHRPEGRPVKYIFVTGGVVSSLGKGLAAASIGRLLEDHGYKVALQKFDPYINVDPGTMSPYQHGEVYVTDDGAETDLDLGHYERYTHAELSRRSNLTTGRIYETIIQKEGPAIAVEANVLVGPAKAGPHRFAPAGCRSCEQTDIRRVSSVGSAFRRAYPKMWNC